MRWWRGRSGSAPGVPSSLLPIFEQAAGTTSSDPEAGRLAAINEVESNFDYSTLPGVHSGTNADGAAGPMQIGIAGAAGDSWAKYQVDAPGGPLPPSVYDETDAVYAAANYLHASGAPGDWPAALYAYNHAGWYVARPQLAQRYAQPPATRSRPARPRSPGLSPPGRPRRDPCRRSRRGRPGGDTPGLRGRAGRDRVAGGLCVALRELLDLGDVPAGVVVGVQRSTGQSPGAPLACR